MQYFFIPWGHNKVIIDKCKGDSAKALFYVKKTLENNWSRDVLLNFLDTDLYERQGKPVKLNIPIEYFMSESVRDIESTRNIVKEPVIIIFELQTLLFFDLCAIIRLAKANKLRR